MHARYKVYNFWIERIKTLHRWTYFLREVHTFIDRDYYFHYFRDINLSDGRAFSEAFAWHATKSKVEANFALYITCIKYIRRRQCSHEQCNNIYTIAVITVKYSVIKVAKCLSARLYVMYWCISVLDSNNSEARAIVTRGYREQNCFCHAARSTAHYP